jgi:hypothetical protein
MKYAMVALRGAWVSGGIEWNFPDGHTLTTVSPIDYVMRMEPDGSAAVAVGDTERVQGMQWQVIIRLRPGQRAVETEVTLNNRREVPGRYWFWSTAGAANPTMRRRFQSSGRQLARATRVQCSHLALCTMADTTSHQNLIKPSIGSAKLHSAAIRGRS